MPRKPKHIAELGDDPNQTLVGTHAIVRKPRCHTPGPWHSKLSEHDNGMTEIKRGDFLVAYVLRDSNQHQRLVDDANARLIACAPEMLDSLIQASEVLEENCACGVCYPCRLLSQIGKLIVKAKGKP